MLSLPAFLKYAIPLNVKYYSQFLKAYHLPISGTQDPAYKPCESKGNFRVSPHAKAIDILIIVV